MAKPGADNIPPDFIVDMQVIPVINMKFSANVGRKGKSHRTCVILKQSVCTKINYNELTAIATKAFSS